MKSPQLVLSANALDGHGKTSFLLTARKPLALFHIDPNTEEVVEKAIDEKLIRRKDVTLYAVPYPLTIFKGRDDIQDMADRTWEEELVTPLEKILDDESVRSVGFDTDTEVFELKMMADHGKTVQVLPEMRTKTNYMYKGLLQALKRSTKDVILLHRLKDVWKNETVVTEKGEEERRNKVSGMYEREGFNKVGYHVNSEVYLMFDASRPKGKDGSDDNRFGLRVGRCLHRPALVTEQADQVEFWDLTSDSWWWGRAKIGDRRVRRASIPYLATKMYPSTKIEDWL
jgi:hypothetical protein